MQLLVLLLSKVRHHTHIFIYLKRKKSERNQRDQEAKSSIFSATNEVIETGVKEGAKKIGEKSKLEGINSSAYEGKVHSKFSWTKVCEMESLCLSMD